MTSLSLLRDQWCRRCRLFVRNDGGVCLNCGDARSRRPELPISTPEEYAAALRREAREMAARELVARYEKRQAFARMMSIVRRRSFYGRKRSGRDTSAAGADGAVE